jgi:hypothetical protein
MADAPRSPGPPDEAPTPRWVYYAAGIVVILVALLVGGMHLSGGFTPPHLAP